MTRQSAKRKTLPILKEWKRKTDLRHDWYYREYGIDTTKPPWHRRFASKLAILHHGTIIFVFVTMSIFLQVADKNPQGLHLDDVNWFYVAAATLAGTIMAVRSYNKCFDTSPV